MKLKSFALQYDRDYGIDRRSGWSVVVDGSVAVQFARNRLVALVRAWLSWRRWEAGDR